MDKQTLVETRGRKRVEDIASKLLHSLRTCFSTLKDPSRDERGKKKEFSLADCLMSAVAMFGLKYPSLLQFDKSVHQEETIRDNLKTLYGVEHAPCDTYMRERLDLVDPKDLRPAFLKIFNQLQRNKVLEEYAYLQEGYIISIDGTGYFESYEIHCKNCCEKNRRNGKIAYYHQMLAASLVSPEKREVIPLCPEPIIKKDGKKKNDCELRAVKRLLTSLREDHPFLKITVVEDTLYGVIPHIKNLYELKMHFLIGVKPKRHKNLFDWLSGQELNKIEFEKEGKVHRFQFFNGAPLGDLQVNFLEYWEIENGAILRHFSWITNILITNENVFRLMRAARSRWRIENETFNTLKNQGYHFEHNFGHGYQHLSTVLSFTMMLAFLIDQAQALCCRLFQGAWKKIDSGVIFWQKLRSIFFEYWVLSWSDLYLAIQYGYAKQTLTPAPNTS
jgi:Transposase DDE domain